MRVCINKLPQKYKIFSKLHKITSFNFNKCILQPEFRREYFLISRYTYNS